MALSGSVARDDPSLLVSWVLVAVAAFAGATLAAVAGRLAPVLVQVGIIVLVVGGLAAAIRAALVARSVPRHRTRPGASWSYDPTSAGR